MVILHLDEQRTWRGGEQQASYLVQGLMRRGARCLIAGRPGSPFLARNRSISGLMRIAAPFRGEADLWTARRLARVIRKHDVDIIHAHTSHTHTTACLACWMAGRGKVVVHRRVDFPPKSTVFNRWKYNWPSHYIAVCERVAEVLREFGIPGERISTIHSSVDLDRFEVAPIDRKDLGIPPDAILLGNVAALAGHKDHANLLDALPPVIAEFPRLRVVIAGEGELRPAIEAQIAKLGLKDTVTLLGHRDDVPRLLRSLDLFVLSSYAEGIGGCTIEALACGKPVVATDAGGVGEVVQNGQTGLLVPPRNPAALSEAILRLLKDQALAERLSANGKRLVQESFAAETLVEHTYEVYVRLLAE